MDRFQFESESDILRVLDGKIEPMPQFVFTGPWSWLSYKIGWLLGAGATKAVREAQYLSRRTQASSTSEKSAWVTRCIVSCVLVGSEFIAARLLFDSRFDHLLSLPLAVVILLALPRPRVRWPLGVARGFIAVTLLATLEKAHRWGILNGALSTGWAGARLPAGAGSLRGARRGDSGAPGHHRQNDR